MNNKLFIVDWERFRAKIDYLYENPGKKYVSQNY